MGIDTGKGIRGRSTPAMTVEAAVVMMMMMLMMRWRGGGGGGIKRGRRR